MKDQNKYINSYDSGHPWYYVLGGEILTPSQILKAAELSGYQGYMIRDINKADKRPEPERSQALRQIMEKVIKDYRHDVSKYRKLVCELRAFRQEYIGKDQCHDVHVNISLKHNHLYNDFAHLIVLEEKLSYQPDLFGFNKG